MLESILIHNAELEGVRGDVLQNTIPDQPEQISGASKIPPIIHVDCCTAFKNL